MIAVRGGVAVPLVIPPGDARLQLSQFLSETDVSDVISSKSTFVIWGYIEYRDPLPDGRVHHIHWCYTEFPVDAGDSWIFSNVVYRPECNISD